MTKNCMNCIHYNVCHTVQRTKNELNDFLKKHPYYTLLSEKNKDKYKIILLILLETTVCPFYEEKQ